MTIVTGKTNAWITTYSHLTPQHFANPEPEMVNHLAFAEPGNDMTSAGWTLVGEATITVNFINADELIGNKVAALRAEAANIRAEATAKCTRIEDQINQLLCLEFTPASEARNG